MFTDRFVKVPTREYDIKHKELTGQEILQDSFEKLNPLDISSYVEALAMLGHSKLFRRNKS